MATLKGKIEHITFRNEENHYTIAKLRTGPEEKSVTVLGTLVRVSPGENVELTGYWQTHPRYGEQFRIRSAKVTLPADIEGITRYLSSGVISGIGPKTALNLVNAFGEKTFEVLDGDPDALLKVDGIGPTKMGAIMEAWEEHHVIRGIMGFLQENSVNAVHAPEILKLYGRDAVAEIATDPYSLIENIPEMGFQEVDRIGMNLSAFPDDPKRIRGCILSHLHQALSAGHTYHDMANLVKKLSASGIDPLKAVEALTAYQDDGGIVIEELERMPDEDMEKYGSDDLSCLEELGLFIQKAVYPMQYYDAEKETADRLAAFLSVPVTAPTADLTDFMSDIMDEIRKKLAVIPSEEQKKALFGIAAKKAAIITGGPGTGKTTLIRAVHTMFSVMGKKTVLAAPTGRAARRLSQVVKKEAWTIHRLLGCQADGIFLRDETNPIEADAVIIDEASMIDTLLMAGLLKAVPMTAVFILVGDVFQLPSVGPGNVLKDLIDSGMFPVFQLTEIFRQAGESGIADGAHNIRCGCMPDIIPISHSSDLDNGTDFYFIETANKKTAADDIEHLITTVIPEKYGFDPKTDVQVLSPMHKGEAGCIRLNERLQNALNPTFGYESNRHGGFIETIHCRFYNGDKVMHLKNNYRKDVYNGDIGIICGLSKSEQSLVVDYDGREVSYTFTELNELGLAYAVTVHKSQGSEYPAVVLYLFTEHYPLLERNLIYTALTRARFLMIIIGEMRAFGIALENDRPRKRMTGLTRRMKEAKLLPAFNDDAL